MHSARTGKPTQGAQGVINSVRWFALLASLLLAQALGFMHGVEHAPRASRQLVPQVYQLHSATPDHRSGWVADLFAGHHDESTCQVFDQLGHGDALLVHAAMLTPAAFGYFFLDVYRGATPLPRRSLIQARGPPVASSV